MALNGEIDQQNVGYTYNVVLVRDPDACYNMDETWKHYAMWN